MEKAVNAIFKIRKLKESVSSYERNRETYRSECLWEYSVSHFVYEGDIKDMVEEDMANYEATIQKKYEEIKKLEEFLSNYPIQVRELAEKIAASKHFEYKVFDYLMTQGEVEISNSIYDEVINRVNAVREEILILYGKDKTNEDAILLPIICPELYEIAMQIQRAAIVKAIA